MNIIKSIVTMLLITATLSGCAMPGKMSNEKLEASKNIAVVSLLGETFHGIHIGGTIFNNEEYEVSLPEWSIDALAEQTTVELLSKNSSRQVSVLKHDSRLSERFVKSFSLFNNGYNYDEVINLAKQQGVDTVVLIQPTRYDNAPNHKPGYGFYERTLFSSKHSCVYSLFTAEVFSTTTGKKTGWEWGFPTCNSENYLRWENSFDKYNNDEKKLLRMKTEENIKENVTKAINSLGFR